MKGCAQWGSTAFRRLSAARMQFSECECLCSHREIFKTIESPFMTELLYNGIYSKTD